MSKDRSARQPVRLGAAVLGSVVGLGSAAGAYAAEDPPGWRPPLAGAPVVVRPFEPPGTPWGPGHRGVDLAAATGATVRAAGAGRVSFAGQVAGRGVVVVAHPGGLRTTYEPVTALLPAGRRVDAGAELGRLDPDGHCGRRPCLHWGLRRGEVYLDPLGLLGGRPGPIVLLPHLATSPPDRPASAFVDTTHERPADSSPSRSAPGGDADRVVTVAVGGAAVASTLVAAGLRPGGGPARRRT